jgi:Putative Actinobacterial Holin-X, holin superfamily III
METAFLKVEEIANSIKDYAELKVDAAKLQIVEKTSAVMANFAAGLVVLVVFLHFIIFGSIALSFGIADYVGKTWLGFLIVALLYLLVGILVWFARVKIIRLPIMSVLITQLFSKDEED